MSTVELYFLSCSIERDQFLYFGIVSLIYVKNFHTIINEFKRL